MPLKQTDDDPGLDAPLWGACAIAQAANLDERSVYYFLQHGLLPATKIGKLWTTTKRRLLARINGEDAYVARPKISRPPAIPPARSRKGKFVRRAAEARP